MSTLVVKALNSLVFILCLLMIIGSLYVNISIEGKMVRLQRSGNCTKYGAFTAEIVLNMVRLQRKLY